jgi:hydrogenase nickel incorporation protein HypA/HybF
MHELAVTESILKIASDYAQRNRASRVTDLYLVIGRLSSLVDDSVQFYWDIISQDTICARAQLHFERIPASILCLDCSNQYVLHDMLCACPKCGSARIKVISGDEFSLDSIAIETE